MSFLSALIVRRIVKKKGNENNKNIIVYPNSWIKIMLFCAISMLALYLFLMLMVLIIPEKMNFTGNAVWVVPLFFGLFELFYLIFIIYLKRFKIIVYEDKFKYYNLFKKTKEYSYKEVYSNNFGTVNRIFLDGKLIVKITQMLDNANILNKAIKEYQKKYKIIPKNIETIKRTKMWIFLLCSYSFCVLLFNILSFFNVWWWYYSLLCWLPAIVYTVYNLLWLVKFDKENIYVRNIFGKTKKYPLNEVSYVYHKKSRYYQGSESTYYKLYHSDKLIAYIHEVEYNSDLVPEKISERKNKSFKNSN